MNITRRRLAEMIESEVREALSEKDDEKKGSKKPTTAAADEEPVVNKGNSGGGPDPISNSPSPDSTSVSMDDIDDAPEEEDDEEAVDPNGDAGENPSGAVNDEVSGKTVQAITVEPKSKVLPGSKEVVMTFNESTDALRILVTSTGQVKFFWRGQLHDIP